MHELAALFSRPLAQWLHDAAALAALAWFLAAFQFFAAMVTQW